MKKMADGVPIAVVEQETGLSKDLLRKWETRYNYPIPDRDKRGDRVYSREQVARLRVIKRLLDGGYRPSSLLSMDADALAELAQTVTPQLQETADATVIVELLEALKAHRPARFRAGLNRQLQAQGLKQFVLDIMSPLSTAVGDAWSRGELRVFEEHLFSDIATAVLRQALDAINSPEGQPRILMTTLPGEMHSLGLLMAACLFALQGAHCIYLGTETPGEEIALAAQAHAADGIALSFSSAFPTRQIQPALTSLRQMVAADMEIVAGGIGISRLRPQDGIHFIQNLANASECFGEKGLA